MKITVLTYLEEENSKDYDPAVNQVASALRKRGHNVSILGVYSNLKKLISGLRRRKPDLVFNLMEMFGEDVTGDIAVADLLTLMRLRYTGAAAGELFLAQDKALAKK